MGKELLKINPDIYAPTSPEINICSESELVESILKYADIVINAAAVTDNRKVEASAFEAIETNIIAAANIATICMQWNKRLVYISTDYVYKGDKGNYKEDSEILPFNLYAWTKLGGECSSRAVENSLIIRTSFGKSEFDYPSAFSDMHTSKDYVDIIAPMIYDAAISNLTGIINIGTERKTMFEYAKRRTENVLPVEIGNNNSPTDSSLNLDRWKDFKKGF